MGIIDRIKKFWKTRVITRSPYCFHFNSGSCNGCDIEIVAALMPRIDLERFGVKLVGSPRHADIMLCTGPVTEQIKPRLQRIYEQMAEPKFVVAVGSCACSGNVFRTGYNVLGGVDQAIPVSAYIPGCPPKPSAITFGAYKLLEVLSGAVAEAEEEPPEVPETTTSTPQEEAAEV